MRKLTVTYVTYQPEAPAGKKAIVGEALAAHVTPSVPYGRFEDLSDPERSRQVSYPPLDLLVELDQHSTN